MRKNSSKQEISNKILHISIIIFFVIIICGFASAVIYKYHVEGEKNATFNISKILVVSTAEGIANENPTAKWDFNLNQNNDVYITIEKNEKKQDIIKDVTINNIQIIQNPSIGDINYYRPAETGLFKCDDKYKIQDELKYLGSAKGSINNLEISNLGGTILIRFCNRNVGKYVSNEDEQILHNGTLLKKANIPVEQLTAKIQFDIIIQTEQNVKYKTTANINLPVGNITEEGTATCSIDTNELILKRM